MINLYDNIKLVLSDYKISDAQCKGLSDILISSHLSESTYDNGLISLIKVLVERRISFPMTYDYFKGLWNLVGDSRYNFANVVVSLAKDNLISIKRISEKDYTDNEDIYGYINGLSLVDTDYENPFINGDIIILRSTETFDNILDTFRTVMLYNKDMILTDTADSIEDNDTTTSTYNKDIMPYKMQQEIDKLKSLIYNDFGCVFYLESFKKNEYTDLYKGVQDFFMSLNVIFDFGSSLSIDNTKLSDIVYQDISKGNSAIKGYDIYLTDDLDNVGVDTVDGNEDNSNAKNSCVYLGVDIYPKDNLVNSINYVDLFNRIYKAILDIVRISTKSDTKDTILDMHTDTDKTE